MLNNYQSVYDIVFMDIVLGKMDGVTASKKLREKDENVILFFVTNMAKYAIDGYEVGALGFFVKPIKYNSFSLKLNNAAALLNRREGFPLKIKVEGGTNVLLSSELIYIDIMRHSITYHTINGDIMAYGILNEREKQLREKLLKSTMC